MKTHSEKEMLVMMNNKTSRSIFNLISVLLVIAKDSTKLTQFKYKQILNKS